MLNLTRRRGESIHIGDDIVITVCRVERGQVSIGIEAPKHINICRKEIAEQFPQDNKGNK